MLERGPALRLQALSSLQKSTLPPPPAPESDLREPGRLRAGVMGNDDQSNNQ